LKIEINKLYYYRSNAKYYTPCIIRSIENNIYFIEMLYKGTTHITKINSQIFIITNLINISNKKTLTKIRLKGLVE